MVVTLAFCSCLEYVKLFYFKAFECFFFCLEYSLQSLLKHLPASSSGLKSLRNFSLIRLPPTSSLHLNHVTLHDIFSNLPLALPCGKHHSFKYIYLYDYLATIFSTIL